MEIHLFDPTFRTKSWKCIGSTIITSYKLLNKLFKNNGSTFRPYNLTKEASHAFLNV